MGRSRKAGGVMACECITRIDKKLAETNTKLSQTIIFGEPVFTTITIETELAAKKRGARPTVMIPTFCPFCGVRYRDPAGRAALTEGTKS